MRITRNGGPLPSRLLRLTFLLLSLFCIAQIGIFRSFSWIQDLLPSFGDGPWRSRTEPSLRVEIQDQHPIRGFMREADRAFQEYNSRRSQTFKKAVDKYRRDHGRHPPPGFDKWYVFVRQRKVENIDDFHQIHDDLRPFWAVEPTELREYAAHASDKGHHGVATISIRDGKVFEAAEDSWRSEDFLTMLRSIARYLPDMDIPMNRMDQPRVVVPWDDLQAALKVEESTRTLNSEGVVDSFTKNMPGLSTARRKSLISKLLNLWNPYAATPKEKSTTPDSRAPIYGWFSHVNKPFMDLASKACPPDSYAQNPESAEHLHVAESSYTHFNGGFVTNYNLSTDLCTVGPQISNLHGLLYSATSMMVTQKLVPIFSECKMSVNNDILFPASIYYKRDDHYHYRERKDKPWNSKDPIMFWRGSTSGGNAYLSAPEKWHSMHRQRLVLLTNSTETSNTTTTIPTTSNNETYTPHPFHPTLFLSTHTDTGFTTFIACLPNCSFYASTFAAQKWLPFSEGFKHKYLIDIDGHSFSGRWRAYLQSRSLALKTTILREWHDSRLQAWRHFVPVDNRYGDLYSLLTYFAGYESEEEGVVVPRHDYEAYRIAEQGRQWAAKVLRREDMEIYLLRLLLEYGRLIDDNRHHIGYVGDGGEEMERFDRLYPAVD